MTLQRRTPLKPGKPLARKSPMPRTVKAARRPRYTGPTAGVKDDLTARAGGRCEVGGCSLTTVGYSRHHRRARGMGGTRRADTNELANLLLVCGSGVTGCHGRIESMREWAYLNGYLVPQGQDPAAVLVVYRGSLVLLGNDGTINPQEAAS